MTSAVARDAKVKKKKKKKKRKKKEKGKKRTSFCAYDLGSDSIGRTWRHSVDLYACGRGRAFLMAVHLVWDVPPSSRALRKRIAHGSLKTLKMLPF